VERFLGEGARKRVYLAHDERLDRDVALARIKTEGLDAETRVRVQREAQAMGRLGDHPHIVTPYDIGEERSELYIVSQYMSGGGLDERLHDGPLALDDVLRIAGELCRALEYAHERGVIHRDLKPGNVWLAADGTAKLGDFGLALSLDRSRLTGEGMMVGTATYMAPEQALSGEVGPPSDVYALGAVLYEMLTGRPPFVGDDAVAVIGQHINTPPVAPIWHRPEIPRALEQLVLAMLAKDPAQRPVSATEVRKGLAAISPSERVASDVAPAPANPLDRLAEGIFVGRESELEQLRSGIDGAFSGRGRVLLVVGEPGIGKTRTAEELGTYASMRGAEVLWGRAYEGEGAPSYWSWIQVIRAHVQESDPSTLLSELGAGASAIADVVSEVRERLPGIQPAAALEAEESRFRLFDSVTSFLRNASQPRPLVLVLDDLHWADRSSLTLLQFLAREVSGSRILVIGTYRDVELRRTHPLAETLGELARVEGTERVLLRGLGEADVGRFLELSTGRPPPSSLVRAVYQETEGNPFFVHEVVRLLVSDGRLDHPEEVESWGLSIPQGIREVVGRRLNGLSEDCNAVLGIASAIGREFDLGVLERVSDLPAEHVLELLEEASSARVVEEMPGGLDRHRFSHALVRETLYEELSTTRRLRLHRRIGDVLEERYAGQAGRHLAELAYHAVEGAHAGGDVEKAIDYATRAALRATALSAFEDAIPQYERALRALVLREPEDALRRCDLLIGLGQAQHFALGSDQAARTLESAVEIAREHSDPLRLARAAALLAFARFVVGQILQSNVELLEEALEALGERDCFERVQVLYQLSREFEFGHEIQRAREVSDRAVQVARCLGDPSALFLALSARWTAYEGPGERDEGFRTARELREAADASGNRAFQLQSRSWLQSSATESGDRAEYEQLFAEEEELLEPAQSGFGEFVHRVAATTRASFDAEWDTAERLAREALELGQRLGNPNARIMFSLHMRVIFAARGEHEALLSDLRGCLDVHEIYRCYLAAWLAVCGHMDEAQALLDELCADDLAAVPPDRNWWKSISSLCAACGLLGDRAHAEQLYRHLSPYPKRGSNIHTGGSTSVWLGVLCTVLERWDEGIAHCDDGLAMLDGFGSRYHMAEGRLYYARLFAHRGGPGDRERALEILNAALDLGHRYDMQGIVKRALEQKLELQGVESSDLQRSIHVLSSAVQERRPDLAPHAAPDGTVTLMFSDMEGFTPMTERLGDLEAREVIRAHNAIVREVLAAHRGYEVELQGDGFLLAFGSARQALHCAIAIQQAFAKRNTSATEPIRVRIGLHTGEALKDADKFFGKTVILASRIAAQARGGEILVSSLLKQLTESTGDLRFGAAREVDLKGITERQRMFAVEWE
jgi:class 3 adenylate cyclase/tRNA A-37 threonylcarbamoyl transferase component Bud32